MDENQLADLKRDFADLKKSVDKLIEVVAGDGMAGTPGLASNQRRLLIDIYGQGDDRENSIQTRISSLEDAKKEALWKWAGAKSIIIALGTVGGAIAGWIVHLFEKSPAK